MPCRDHTRKAQSIIKTELFFVYETPTASACKGFIDTAARPVAQRRPTKMFARLRCGGNLPLREDSVPETGFYGTEEIFGAKNSLLWYATHLQRPQNSRLHRLWTASCPPDAFSEACRAKSSTCCTGRIFSARNGPRSLCSLRPIPPFPSSR